MARGRVNLDARSETEWGTLRSFLRVQGDGGDDPRADQAWISLGGLRMGYSESAWTETTSGVDTDGSHSNGKLWYGDQQRHLIQYSFGGDSGLFGVISVEDHGADNYMPNVVSVVSYEQDWGGVWGRVGYDQQFDGFGASAGIEVNIPGRPGSSFRFIAYYADGDHAYGTGSSYQEITGGFGNAEWAALASYYHQITSNFGASVGFEYFRDFYAEESSVKTGLNGYVAELSLIWKPAENLEVSTEVTYDKLNTFDGSVGGFLRFQRDF